MLCDCYNPNCPEESPLSAGFRAGVSAVHVILMCLGTVGTACVFAVFLWDRTLWKPSYFFIGFLAFIHMLHIVVVGTFKLQFFKLLRWTDEDGCWWSGVTALQMMTSPVITTVVIAINRYVRVCQSKPVYNKVFHMRLVVLMCLGVSVLAGLWAVSATVTFYPSLPMCFLDARQSHVRLSLLMVQYVIGYCIVILLYCRIIRKLTRLDHRLKANYPSSINATTNINLSSPVASKFTLKEAGRSVSSLSRRYTSTSEDTEEEEEEEMEFFRQLSTSHGSSGQWMKSSQSASLDPTSLERPRALPTAVGDRLEAEAKAGDGEGVGYRLAKFAAKGHQLRRSITSRSVDNLKVGFVICVLNMTTSVSFWCFFVIVEMLEQKVPEELQSLSHLLLLCGSALNSVVYGVMNHKFRESASRLWRRLRRRGPRIVRQQPTIITPSVARAEARPVTWQNRG
ncbi:hypothetical protein ACOMHN_032702 [Nucella lapillus]